VRGAVLRNVGDETLEVRDDVTTVDLTPGHVRVKIRATGLCHSDLSAMRGVIPQPTPAVLGHEAAGEVIEVGEGVDTVAPGDHVIVAWNPYCGKCSACNRGEFHLCSAILFSEGFAPHFKVGGEPAYGFAGNGTFTEEVILPATGVVRIPSDVPFEVAAIIGCGVMTGVGAAINTAKVVPGSSVVVFGCGGVGIATIQGAKIAGASEIVAVDLVQSKHEKAKKFGATRAVTPDQLGQASLELTGGEGFDYAFECIGLSSTARAAIDAVRRGGTAVIVGAGRQDDEFKLNMWEMFFNEKKILGCYYGSTNVKKDFPRLIGLWRAGRLDLEGMVDDRLDLSQINEALERMKRGEAIRQVFVF
jgi:S-(hydroxymethyl)glutathione dehydrogenase/alcohol dehydrogenase